MRFPEEIRLKRRQPAEEVAAKTKIIFPLVRIFTVVLAPAMLRIARGLKGMVTTREPFQSKSDTSIATGGNIAPSKWGP
jgi:hypothetical protein